MNSTRQHLLTAQAVIAHARRGPAANRPGGAITAEQSLIISQSCKDSMKTRLVLSSDWGAAPPPQPRLLLVVDELATLAPAARGDAKRAGRAF